MNSSSPNPGDALAHLGWVRGLALGLARDANVAEDVVQEAYLLSLQRPPRDASRLVPWLARVTRTLARQHVRSSRSRRRREQSVAQVNAGHASEEPHEILARGERQRAVADAVLGLPEPYAATILYHYLDGLSTVEVARRMDTGPTTVRKRLERARAMLRERLDQEFGGETESWALGLVVPFSQWRVPTPASVAAGTGAKSLLVGSWMGSKLIGLVGIVLATGLFVLSRGLGGASSIGADPGGIREDQEILATLPTSSVSSAAKSAPASLRTPLSAIVEAETDAVAKETELAKGEVLLLIRGLLGDGTPITTGRVDCFWDSSEQLRGSVYQHHIAVDIQSEVTRVVLPEAANSVRVCVSHRASPPAPGLEVSELHKLEQGGAPGDVPTHQVDVPLAAPLANDNVQGNIFWDGRLECPPGLRLYLDGGGYAWINSITSSYRISPLREDPGALRVSSDFCLPTSVELEGTPGKSQRIDLELESGRELLVLATDAVTGALAVGREVTIGVQSPKRTTLFRKTSDSHQQTKVVDSAGYCRFRGIPIEGQVTVLQRLEDGVGRRVLEMLQLDASMPPVVQCEVRLESSKVVLTRVHGRLPLDENADASGLRTVRFTSWNGGQSQSATVRREGQWSVQLASHQVWDARVYFNDKQRSDGKPIELKGEEEHGPLQLGYWGSETVTLGFVDVPLSGRIEIESKEIDSNAQQHRSLNARGEDLDVTLHLSGPARIQIALIAKDGDSEFGWQQHMEVDPRTQDRVVIDLRGSQALGVSLRINGRVPTGEGYLLAMKPMGTTQAPQRVQFLIRDGRALEPQVVEPGRWLYLFQHGQFPGLVCGWLNVPEKSGRALSIDWKGASRSTTELGSGVELLELDGVDMKAWSPGQGSMPWSPDQLAAETLWLPLGLKFEITN